MIAHWPTQCLAPVQKVSATSTGCVFRGFITYFWLHNNSQVYFLDRLNPEQPKLEQLGKMGWWWYKNWMCLTQISQFWTLKMQRKCSLKSSWGYASTQCSVAGSIMDLSCPCVRLETLLTRYPAKYFIHFHQTYINDALWDYLTWNYCDKIGGLNKMVK